MTDVAAVNTSVHVHETNVDTTGVPATNFIDDEQSFETSFRHSGWSNIRRRIYQSLQRCCDSPSRLSRWRMCGRLAWLMRSPDTTDTFKIHACYCRDRFCRPCTTARSNVISENILDHLKNRRSRFLTLTLQSSTESLTFLTNKLIRDFRKLRQTPFWARYVAGGVSFIEAKWNAPSARWHVHIHAIIEGQFVPHSELREQWFRATGTSTIVDIREVKNSGDVVRYAAKYATKSIDSETTRHPERLDEAVIALSGRRMATTFGSWRGVKLNDRPKGVPWVPVCTLTFLADVAKCGNRDALTILNALKHGDPLTPHGVRIRNFHGPPGSDRTIEQFAMQHPFHPAANLEVCPWEQGRDTPNIRPRPTGTQLPLFETSPDGAFQQ